MGHWVRNRFLQSLCRWTSHVDCLLVAGKLASRYMTSRREFAVRSHWQCNGQARRICHIWVSMSSVGFSQLQPPTVQEPQGHGSRAQPWECLMEASARRTL